MRVAVLAAGLVTALAVQPVAAQRAPAQTGAPLKASSAWDIDYGENLCTLSRSFDGGKQPIALGLIPLTGGGQLKILTIGLPNSRIGKGTARIFGNEEDAVTRSYYATTDPKNGKPIMMVRARRADLEKIGASGVLTIDVGKKPVRFAVTGIAAALKALEACETDLAKTWGYDPATAVSPARPVTPGRWLTNADYPTTALLQREAGETDFRMTVGPDGKPTECIVLVKSGSPTLDKQTCDKLMHRASFMPAKGPDGKPVRGIYSDAVMWMLNPDF